MAENKRKRAKGRENGVYTSRKGVQTKRPGKRGATALVQPKLLPQQKKAVDYYFGDADFNKVEACRLAGYGSPETNAWSVFQHPAVKAEIAAREEQNKRLLTVQQELLIDRLLVKAQANLGAIMAKLREYNYNLNALTPDEQYVISEFSEEIYIEGRGENAVAVKRVKLKIESNLAALDKLMRHIGAYKDDNGNELEEDVVRRLQAGRNRMRLAKEDGKVIDHE